MNPEFEDHFPYSVTISKLVWNTMDVNDNSDRQKLLQWCYHTLGESRMHNMSSEVTGDWCLTWQYASDLEYHLVVYVRTHEHALWVQMTWC